MSLPYSSFVILADMRTGSNLLEARLNAVPGIACHGEVFNPVFIGHEGQETLHVMDLSARDADPMGFLDMLRKKSTGLPGFRLFPDHAPRVLSACLADRACAKVVLTRNPLDSYISLKIARATGQWWMGDASKRRPAKVRFDSDEFEDELERRGHFYEAVRRALMETGQAAFHLRYTDLQDEARIAGLARWLGIAEAPEGGDRSGRVQNPEPARDKVENPDEMAEGLARLDLFGLLDDPDFEPRRGPNVRTWAVSDGLRCLFLPVPGVPERPVTDWLTAADDAPPRTGLTRRELQAWRAETPGHRTVTVVAHPLARAWRAFERHIVADGPDRFAEIRGVLERRYGMVLPDAPGAPADVLRAAFLSFLGFLKLNLNGQTSVRVPAVWASQSELLRGMADVALADAILREETALQELARLFGHAATEQPEVDGLSGLHAICDAEIEGAAAAAYRKDYAAFGFGPWRLQAA
jgi:LPS sulfotransferase NodH